MAERERVKLRTKIAYTVLGICADLCCWIAGRIARSMEEPAGPGKHRVVHILQFGRESGTGKRNKDRFETLLLVRGRDWAEGVYHPPCPVVLDNPGNWDIINTCWCGEKSPPNPLIAPAAIAQAVGFKGGAGGTGVRGNSEAPANGVEGVQEGVPESGGEEREPA